MTTQNTPVPADNSAKDLLNTESDFRELLQNVASTLNNDPEQLAQFSWNYAANYYDFLTPTEIDESELAVLQPGLNDVMLAHIATLGHRDKFPRQYDWENLIPSLATDEELLWIAQKEAGTFRLFLGLKFNRAYIEDVDAINERRLRFQILCDSFIRRAFPESSIMQQDARKVEDDLKNILSLKNNAYCLIGMPSYKTAKNSDIIAERNEEKRPFASINDVLESHLNTGDDFTVIFSISHASPEVIQKSAQVKFKMRDLIKPLIERSINLTSGKTKGTNSNISITPAHEVTSVSESVTKKHNFLKAAWQGFAGNNPEKLDKIKAGKKREGYFFDRTPGVTKTINTTFTPELRVSSSGEHEDENASASLTFTVANSEYKFIDEQLEESLTHLRQVPGTGGYFSTVLVYAQSTATGESVARSIRATLSGSQSYLRPIQIFKLNLNNAEYFPFYNRSISDMLQEHGFCHEILNCEKACLSLLLPDTECPGIKMKKSVFYARPQLKSENNSIRVGTASYYADLLNSKKLEEKDFKIDSKDLCSHIFLVGTTGSGKTNRAEFILNNITLDTRLLILETAKKTYCDAIGRKNRNLCVYTLGNSQDNPFRINPFFFEPGSNLKQHIAVLADAISDLLPMEALIGPKLREAVENCYKRCGWDVEDSTSKFDIPTYPDMLMFNSEVNKICDSLKDYGPEVRSNYRGALLNRSQLFVDDVYQDIFAYGGNKTIDELFPPNVDSIIEMEDMPPSEINMPAFIISILLHRIRAYQSIQNVNRKNFLIVIEEAHNVLSKKFETKGDEKQSGKGGHLVNQVVRLLAEGRGLGLGIMVIDQSANAIAPAVLANTNMKIVFRQEDGEEIKTIGTAIGLAEEDWPDLQKLGTGECIIKSKSSFKPVKIAPLPTFSSKDRNVKRITLSDTCAPYIPCEKLLTSMYSNGVFLYSDCQNTFSAIKNKCQNNREVICYVVEKFLLKIHQYDLLDYFFACQKKDNDIINVLMFSMDASYSKNLQACLGLLAICLWPDEPLRLEWEKQALNGNVYAGLAELRSIFEKSPFYNLKEWEILNETFLKSPQGITIENFLEKTPASIIVNLNLKSVIMHMLRSKYMKEYAKQQRTKEVEIWQSKK